MNNSIKVDVILLICSVVFVLILFKVINKKADGECKKLLSMAQTRTDTLTVYGMKPYNQFSTCYAWLK
jgi:hypothetical protein